MLVHHLGFFSLNACRIVYRGDNDAGNKRFGFAYGTLEEHAESGEERFTVEWNRANDKVCDDSRSSSDIGESRLSALALPAKTIR